MPLAKEVAAELRRVADALDAEPESELVRPWLHFYSDAEEKTQFLAAVRLLPKPLTKEVRDPNNPYWSRISVHAKTAVVWAQASIPQSAICEIVTPAQPAVYHCPPLLSQEEEEALQ